LPLEVHISLVISIITARERGKKGTSVQTESSKKLGEETKGRGEGETKKEQSGKVAVAGVRADEDEREGKNVHSY
jgi:hypothetical protein